MPPRVLASGPEPCGGNNNSILASIAQHCGFVYTSVSSIPHVLSPGVLHPSEKATEVLKNKRKQSEKKLNCEKIQLKRETLQLNCETSQLSGDFSGL